MHRYRLTDAGDDLRPLIEHMGNWGAPWVDSALTRDNLDMGLLMWAIRRDLDLDQAVGRNHVRTQGSARLMTEFRRWLRESPFAAARRERPLYERLGERPGIEAIVHLMEGVNREHLVQQVTDFLASGTGGDEVYEGRDKPEAHAHLDINDAEFLAAGGDVAQAMRANGHGDAEIEEVTCMFMSLHEQVVAH